MGKTFANVKVENLEDRFEADRGTIPGERIRWVELDEAEADSRATILSMPTRLIRELGLTPVREMKARTATGIVSVRIYSVVRMTVQGRDCTTEVAELPEDGPVHLGQIPLTLLDLVVDPVGRRLVGNPEHGGEDMLEMY